MLGQFHRHLSCQRDHCGLGGTVSGAPRADGTNTSDRCDVDDASPVPTQHQPRRSLSAQQRTGHVDVHGRGEVVEREVQKGEDLGDTRAVDKNVTATEVPVDLCKGLCNGLRPAHVHGQSDRLSAGLPQALSGCGGGICVKVGHQHRVSSCSQILANLRTDAHGTTSDHRNALCRIRVFVHTSYSCRGQRKPMDIQGTSATTTRPTKSAIR